MTEEVEQEVSAEEIQVKRENAKRVLRESSCADILRTVNKEKLKGRGWFSEYNSGVIFKWGQGYTRRHIWVHIDGDAIKFRLLPHRKCATGLCDGEYHIFTKEMWLDRPALEQEIRARYDDPVAEPSDD